jgi:hypothetical protein
MFCVAICFCFVYDSLCYTLVLCLLHSQSLFTTPSFFVYFTLSLCLLHSYFLFTFASLFVYIYLILHLFHAWLLGTDFFVFICVFCLFFFFLLNIANNSSRKSSWQPSPPSQLILRPIRSRKCPPGKRNPKTMSRIKRVVVHRKEKRPRCRGNDLW